MTCSARFNDYDRDGWTDVFIANCFWQESRVELLHNNGDGTFTDVAFGAGLVFSPSGHPLDYDTDSRPALSFGDYDLDGDLDVFAPGRTDKPLFENNGDGTYSAVLEQDLGIVSGHYGGHLAISFVDFENNGHPDFFYVDSDEHTSTAVLYMNNGDKTFVRAAEYPVVFTGGAATGDYDNDGFVDVVVVSSKSSSANGEPLLLHNRGGENAWITVRTVGVESNRDGVGAFVTVHAGGEAYVQEVSAGAGLSTNSPWLTFGLGSS